VKKTMIAAIAALMLAGGLSAVSGATSLDSTNPMCVVGDGSAPSPAVISMLANGNDPSSLTKRF
jgi:hypothetical protein